jgi:peptidoglycan/LPS O-acetylase OafA/YrhL
MVRVDPTNRRRMLEMNRVPELDGIRALAALAVVMIHAYPGSLALGWSAVDCFFVLSGFLITGILLRNRNDPRMLLNFWIRRGLRIWPIYYITIFGLLTVFFIFGREEPVTTIVQTLTYTQNIQGYFGVGSDRQLGSFHHAWTLAIEEQYYCIWPIIILLCGRRKVTAISIFLLVLPSILRFVGISSGLLLTRCDGFALGALLAILFNDPATAGRPKLRAGLFAATVVASLVAVCYIYIINISDSGGMVQTARTKNLLIPLLSALYFGIIGLAYQFRGSSATAFLRIRPLTYLGLISYGFYLYHIPIIELSEVFMNKYPYFAGFYPPKGGLWRGVINISISLAAAASSWRFIESPILSLKDRFQYAKPSDPVVLSSDDRIASSRIATRRETEESKAIDPA